MTLVVVVGGVVVVTVVVVVMVALCVLVTMMVTWAGVAVVGVGVVADLMRRVKKLQRAVSCLPCQTVGMGKVIGVGRGCEQHTLTECGMLLHWHLSCPSQKHCAPLPPPPPLTP
jgi:hypothetical protein